MRSQVYYLSLASCLSGHSSKEGPRVLGMAFCLSHTSILQDDASGVFDTPELRSKTARWPRPSVLLAFVEAPSAGVSMTPTAAAASPACSIRRRETGTSHPGLAAFILSSRSCPPGRGRLKATKYIFCYTATT